LFWKVHSNKAKPSKWWWIGFENKKVIKDFRTKEQEKLLVLFTFML